MSLLNLIKNFGILLAKNIFQELYIFANLIIFIEDGKF